MNVLMSDLRNNCEGHGLLNRPPMGPHLHDCWWRNEPRVIHYEMHNPTKYINIIFSIKHKDFYYTTTI